MRFSTAISVVLGVATVVSALPIAQFTSSLELERRDDFDAPYMSERDFYEPSLYRRMDHYGAHKSNVQVDNGTIKKAYHAVAQLSHPDKGGSESEAKIASVNEAYQGFSNPELRQYPQGGFQFHFSHGH